MELKSSNRVKRANQIIERALELGLQKGTIKNADDFRCGALSAIFALYPSYAKKCIKSI